MAKAFHFDMTSCIGCKTCQVACKDKNDLPIGTLFRTVESYEVGEFPAVDAFHVSLTCNHCENPACVAACASGAMYKSEEGVVLHDDALCMGCGDCVEACPYGVPKMLETGKAGKCDSCYAIRQDGFEPQCVSACPMRALDFGELEDLLAKYPDAVPLGIMPFMPESETVPTTLVTPKAIVNEEFEKIVY